MARLKTNKIAILALVTAAFIAASAMAISWPGKDTFWKDAKDHPGKDLVNFMPNSFNPIAEKVSPSVVTVYSTRVLDMPGNLSPFFWFFGPPGREFEQQGAGSGFIITEDGYIITNAHVVQDAKEIKVSLGEEKGEYEAELIGLDKKTDIALLKIEAKNLPAAVLGDSDELKMGDWVVAIGSPFQLPYTISAGIVSYKGRNLPLATRLGGHRFPYTEFIQTDVSINPGNSGGPLVNMKGEVVGINTLIFSPSGGSVGVGFSIPINLAKKILPQLKEHGTVTRSYLGVKIRDLDKETAKRLGLDEPEGALVTEVEVGGPADKAGIQIDDVIILFEGQKIASSRELPLLVSTYGVGEKAEITWIRNGKRMSQKVKLEEMPSEEELLQRQYRGATSTNNILGVGVKALAPDEAAELGYQGLEGVLVVSVKVDSPAARHDIQVGDLIQKINNNQIASIADFENAVQELTPGKMVRISLRRGNLSIYRYFTLRG